jgi:hypothetical protein
MEKIYLRLVIALFSEGLSLFVKCFGTGCFKLQILYRSDNRWIIGERLIRDRLEQTHRWLTAPKAHPFDDHNLA